MPDTILLLQVCSLPVALFIVGELLFDFVFSMFHDQKRTAQKASYNPRVAPPPARVAVYGTTVKLRTPLHFK